jgi:hypothetical protein
VRILSLALFVGVLMLAAEPVDGVRAGCGGDEHPLCVNSNLVRPGEIIVIRAHLDGVDSGAADGERTVEARVSGSRDGEEITVTLLPWPAGEGQYVGEVSLNATATSDYFDSVYATADDFVEIRFLGEDGIEYRETVEVTMVIPTAITLTPTKASREDEPTLTAAFNSVRYPVDVETIEFNIVIAVDAEGNDILDELSLTEPEILTAHEVRTTAAVSVVGLAGTGLIIIGWTAIAHDAEGNLMTTAEQLGGRRFRPAVFSWDQVSPEAVSNIAVKQGGNLLEVSWDLPAEDRTIAEVQTRFDDERWETQGYSVGVSMYRNIPDGNHVMAVRLVDVAGNIGAVSTLEFETGFDLFSRDGMMAVGKLFLVLTVLGGGAWWISNRPTRTKDEAQVKRLGPDVDDVL